MKLQNKILITTFALFMTEAVLHYNMGREDCVKKAKKTLLPPTKTLIRIGVIVGVFSILNGAIIASVK